MSCERERLFVIRPPVRPKGLLAGKNKRILAIIASGASYKEARLSALDHAIPYLRFIFGFMGITDIQFIQAGGTAAVAQGRISPKDFLAPYLNQMPRSVGVQ